MDASICLLREYRFSSGTDESENVLDGASTSPEGVSQSQTRDEDEIIAVLEG